MIDPNDVGVAGHRLVGVDHRGETCSCGEGARDLVEHFAAVVLAELDVPPLSTRQVARRRAASMQVQQEELRWAERQQREHNLASYGRPLREPRRAKTPPVISPDVQLEIALRSLAKREAA